MPLFEIPDKIIQEIKDAYTLQNTKSKGKGLEYNLAEAQRLQQNVGEQVCAIVMRTIFTKPNETKI